MATWRKYFNSSDNGGMPLGVTGENQAGQFGAARFSSWLTEVYAGSPNRLMRYIQYDQMDNDLEINAALDIIAEFCTQDDEHNKLPFTFEFKEDPSVRFCIPKSADCFFEIFDKRIMLTHGDLLGGAMTDPIIGALGGISRGDQKLRKRQESLGKPYDILICGHWHQYSLHPRRIINGSLKGYDEFAYQHSFFPETPIQPSWLMQEDIGITVAYPINCS